MVEDIGYRQTGKRLNYTLERMRQIEKSALTKIRNKVLKYGGEEFIELYERWCEM